MSHTLTIPANYGYVRHNVSQTRPVHTGDPRPLGLGENGTRTGEIFHESPAQLNVHRGHRYDIPKRRLESNHRSSTPRFRKGLPRCLNLVTSDVREADVRMLVVWIDTKIFGFQRPSCKVLHAPADFDSAMGRAV